LTYLQPGSTATGLNPTLGIARYAVGSTWDTTITSPTPNPIDSVASTVNANGTPFVAWGDPNDGHVHVATFAGSAWTMFGTNADVGLPGAEWRATSLALNNAGDPTVGISGNPEQMGTPSGNVSSWSASAWQLLSPALPGGGRGGPLIDIDSTGAPVVLSGGQLQRYTNGSWLTVSLGSLQPYLTMALDSLDRPVLASETLSGTTYTLDVSTLMQNAWQSLSPVTTAPAFINEAQVTLASGDIPVVVWTITNGSGQDLHVARYNTTTGTWTSTFDVINALGLGAGTAAHVQLVVDSVGRPCVAWDEGNTAGTSSVYTWMSNL
jgi:hypothetical protein